MFRGIFKMPAGCRAFVKPDGSMKAERYWDALPGRGDDLAELRRLSGQALRDYAVRAHAGALRRRPSRSG